jgi:nitrogen regulatory protein PII
MDKLGNELGGKIFVTDVSVAVDLTTKNRGETSI